MTIDIKIIQLHPDAIIPEYATSGSSGFDLRALETTRIICGQTKIIRTGLAFEIPDGFEMQIRPRSGLSAKTKLRVANAPATIDADFRGEVCIIIENTSSCAVELINANDRIAQGVICPVIKANFIKVTKLTETERGSDGFGSTGVQ